MGGLSDRDARALAPDMRTTSDFLVDTQRDGSGASFNCFVRNYTPRGIHLGIAFGVLEAEPTMSAEAHRKLRATNRAAYSYQRMIEAPEPTDLVDPPVVAATTNRSEEVARQSPGIDQSW